MPALAMVGMQSCYVAMTVVPDHLQHGLPYDPTGLPHMRRLPGTVPLGDAPWILPDEAYAGQMRLRDGLVAEMHDRVIAELPGSDAAVAELYAAVLDQIGGLPGFRVGPLAVRRPDGAEVPRDLPVLDQLARLVQEDLCVMEARDGTHVLSAAALLFPAHWTLAEKLGRPLLGIHDPVEVYDADVGRRVQRLFDALKPERPIWRFNLHGQDTTDLFAPLREGDAKPKRQLWPPYVRSERQVLRRLPETGAVVFSIKTYLVPSEVMPAGLMALLAAR